MLIAWIVWSTKIQIMRRIEEMTPLPQRSGIQIPQGQMIRIDHIGMSKSLQLSTRDLTLRECDRLSHCSSIWSVGINGGGDACVSSVQHVLRNSLA
jgi:hypothetical protein